MGINRRLLTTAPGGMTVDQSGFAPKTAFTSWRVLHHALSITAVVVAVVLAREPSAWLRSTLFVSVLLVVFLAGTMRLRLASTWPASLVLLTFMIARPIIGWIPESGELWKWGYLHLPVSLLIGIFIFESAARRVSEKGLSRREIGLCGVLGFLMVGLVILPAVESWFATDNAERALAVMLLVIVARSVVLAGASVRVALCSRFLLGVALVVVAMALSIQAVGLWAGTRPPHEMADTPMVIAHGVREQFALNYPRWQSDPETLDGMWLRYRGELAAASLGCDDDGKPCIEMLHALRSLLAEYGNGHTELFIPSEMARPPLSIAVTDDGLGIDWVEPGSSAEAAGLESGQQVIAIDGVSTEAAARATPTWRVAYAAPHKREYESYSNLLSGLPHTTVALTVETPDGERRTAHLKRQPTGEQWERNFLEEHEPELWWSVGDDGIGLMWIGSLEGLDMADHFEAAMSELERTPGLVIDLRGNGGGSIELALELVGYFLPRPTILGYECREAEFEDQEYECSPWRVNPSANRYAGRVAVLIDEDTVSAAELLTYGLCVVGDARCFGRTTAGETDTVVFHEIPGAVVAMAASEFRPAVGESIQGVGVVPDVRIGLTLDDLRQERDAVFEAARSWLESELNSPVD